MTDNSFPMVPPPELIDQWRRAPEYTDGLERLTMVTITVDRLQYIATQAACWGADQELLACGNYLEKGAAWEPEDVTELYNYRRPKPPSLKEQALMALEDGDLGPGASLTPVEVCIIRRALSELPND